MIVLDTNVISELMRASPDPAVLAWVVARPRRQFCTTSINRAEILHGIAILPAGRRREAIAAAADAMFAEDFAGRILPFDADAAAHYAEIVSTRRRAGQPIEGFDALIAATARAAGAAVATRDTGGFQGCGLTLANPWTDL
ncbi:PIN domain-containing protein [Methylobacterium symbioticum]|uniref:PIN domain-containing protein n=1 Tax=uncultured Methylobacterium sp. TaxID=157278 RepID=UPI0025928F86|nr:PIN domain-containing protein [uncultured Methylobacterium sp.]